MCIDACLRRRLDPRPFLLALASTFAGNLLVVGSIANRIVIDVAGRRGIAIDWRAHARTGVPVALLTLALAGLWLAALSSCS